MCIELSVGATNEVIMSEDNKTVSRRVTWEWREEDGSANEIYHIQIIEDREMERWFEVYYEVILFISS